MHDILEPEPSTVSPQVKYRDKYKAQDSNKTGKNYKLPTVLADMPIPSWCLHHAGTSVWAYILV